MVKNSIIFTVAEHVVRQALFVALVGEGTGLGSKAFFSQKYTFNLYRESDTRLSHKSVSLKPLSNPTRAI
jgi:hypothetical protein